MSLLFTHSCGFCLRRFFDDVEYVGCLEMKELIGKGQFWVASSVDGWTYYSDVQLVNRYEWTEISKRWWGMPDFCAPTQQS